MKTLALFLLGTLLLPAQNPADNTASPSPPPRAVRRFTFGGTMTFSLLPAFSGATITQNRTSPPIDITSKPKSESGWFGGGVNLQATTSSRTAIATELLIRNVRYRLANTQITGTDNPNTTNDERKTTTTNELTSARYWEIPVLFRRYNIPHDESGRRWFAEAGGSFRHAFDVRTGLETTANSTTDCCEAPPARPSKRNQFGVTAGAGMQLIDDFGIHLVPEVRYTYWLGRTFDTLGARSRRNQIELTLSFTF